MNYFIIIYLLLIYSYIIWQNGAFKQRNIILAELCVIYIDLYNFCAICFPIFEAIIVFN